MTLNPSSSVAPTTWPPLMPAPPIFIAFSTANPGADAVPNTAQVSMLSNRRIDDLFEATVFATEEAVINAMVAAETMIGRDNHQTIASPHEELKQALRKYGRLAETK